MCKWNISLLFAFIGYGIIFVADASEKKWTYIIENFEWNSTNENVIAAHLQARRIVPEVYGLNGTIHIGAPISNEYTVRIRVFRSATGSNQYTLTPFAIPKCPFYFFMNKFYKKFAMADVEKCSNMPVFEKFDKPLPVGDYHVDSCVISNDAMPSHMMSGFYRIVYEVDGPLTHFMCVVTSKVFQK